MNDDLGPIRRGMARLLDGLAAVWWLIWRASAIAIVTPLVRYGSQWLWGQTVPWWLAALIAAGFVLLPWIVVRLVA